MKFRYLSVFALLFCLVEVAGCEVREHIISTTVVNSSSIKIDWIKVTVYDKTYSAVDLSPSESFAFSFNPMGDSQYDVEWKLENGASKKQSVGYIPTGTNARSTLEVMNKKIDMINIELTFDKNP
ncbi:MAG: hypothetical protein COB33_001555 [Thiotrichaceae bacterium]|nr:hypothetical protein [Thiotrichaceae bacterium]PCI11672.1 MAG: hypothetical protein COB71_11310 [Thiotrichales bacterium]PCI15162.1 MAG: hypothetical protein COB71_01120 [Thiotrichales bacterium]